MTTKRLHGDQRFVQKLLPWLDEMSIRLLKFAYAQAKAAHYAQWRKDGRRYF
jgi:hypothetical protein